MNKEVNRWIYVRNLRDHSIIRWYFEPGKADEVHFVDKKREAGGVYKLYFRDFRHGSLIPPCYCDANDRLFVIRELDWED